MSTQGSAFSRSRSKGSLEGNSDIIEKDPRDISRSGNASSGDPSTAEENTSNCPTARLLSFSSDESLDIHMPLVFRTARENSAFSDTSAGSTGSTAISPMMGQHFSDLATAISQKPRGRSPTTRPNTNSRPLTPREAWSQVPPGVYSVIKSINERPDSARAPPSAFYSYPIGSLATSGTSTPYTTTDSTSLMDFSTAKSPHNSTEELRIGHHESATRAETSSPYFFHSLRDDDTKVAMLFNSRILKTADAAIVLGAPGCRAVSVVQNSDVDHLVIVQPKSVAVTENGTTDENDSIKVNNESSSGQNVSSAAVPVHNASGKSTFCPPCETSEAAANQMNLASTLKNLQDTINYLDAAVSGANAKCAGSDEMEKSIDPVTTAVSGATNCTIRENPADYGSPVSASGSRPPSVYERDHWDLARNANSDQNSTLREKKDHRNNMPELNELEIDQVAALIADVKMEVEQLAKRSMSHINTAIEAPVSPTSGVATAHEWSASPTPGVRTALEVPMSPTTGVSTALEISDTPTKGVATAMDFDQKRVKGATTTSAREFSTANSSLPDYFRLMGPDILDSSRLATSEMATTPLHELFTTRPPTEDISCSSDVSVPTPIPSPCPSAQIKSNVTQEEGAQRSSALEGQAKPKARKRGLFGTNQKQGLTQSSHKSPVHVSPNLYPERRQKIIKMRLRQSKSRSRSRSRSSHTNDSQMQTASLASSFHSHHSASSSEKPSSESGQRLGGSGIGKACSRLLREYPERPPIPTSQKKVETVEDGHLRRMSMPSALRSTATESSIREANSTTVLSSAASSRLGLRSCRRQSTSSVTTSGSRFGRRIRPGDGYPTNTGTSSRNGFQSRQSLHLPAGRFGLPPAPKGWENRQRDNESLSVEPEVGGETLRKSENSVKTARISAVTNVKAVGEKNIDKRQDTSLKTAKPLKSKKADRRQTPQDTQPSYYGLRGRIKRLSRKSKHKPTNASATSAHLEEAPTQQMSPDTVSSRRVRDQISPRLKTAIASFESSNTQIGVKPAKIVIHEQNADGSFKLELHVSCKMNSTGHVNISGTVPDGLIPKRVTVNGKNIWAGV